MSNPAPCPSPTGDGIDLAALLTALGDLPMAWILASLAATGAASDRTRRLPAEAVMVLLVAMGLLRDRAIPDVANDLGLVRSAPDDDPIDSNAVSGARTRLGEAPIADLAARCARAWAPPSAEGLRWRGLGVYGIDGSTLRVADTPANRAHFGGQRAGSTRGPSGYPLARIVALMVLRSHLLAALAIGPYTGSSELSLTPALVVQIPDAALTIFDRNFLSAALLLGYARAGTDRYWLTRAKSTTRWQVVTHHGAGDDLVEMKVSDRARAKDPTLPTTWHARAIRYHRRGFRPQVLLTSLLDPQRWPAHEIVGLYHERWELELGLDELKTEQLGREETLRSRSPWAVRQEIWGLMIGYNIVRQRAAAGAARQGVAPTRMSFVGWLRQVQDRWLILAVAGVEAAARVDAHQRRQEGRTVLPRRRSRRQYPRAVKIKMSNYARKRPVAA